MDRMVYIPECGDEVVCVNPRNIAEIAQKKATNSKTHICMINGHTIVTRLSIQDVIRVLQGKSIEI